DEARVKAGEKALDQMLLTLHQGGFVKLEPEPVATTGPVVGSDASAQPGPPAATEESAKPRAAHATPALDQLLIFRSIHPLYGAYLLQHLGIANPDERIQALESVLEMPRPLLKFVRVPFPEDLPPGPLAMQRLDPELIQRGLIAAPLPPSEEDEDE